jgi:hypothetical protein
MTVIKGATIVAAAAPEMKSEANRRPRFFVFQVFASCNGSEAFWEQVKIFDEGASIFGAGGSSPDVRGVIVRALTLYTPSIAPLKNGCKKERKCRAL